MILVCCFKASRESEGHFSTADTNHFGKGNLVAAVSVRFSDDISIRQTEYFHVPFNPP